MAAQISCVQCDAEDLSYPSDRELSRDVQLELCEQFVHSEVELHHAEELRGVHEVNNGQLAMLGELVQRGGQEQSDAQEKLSVQVLDDELVLIRGREQNGVQEFHAEQEQMDAAL